MVGSREALARWVLVVHWSVSVEPHGDKGTALKRIG